MKKNFRLLLLLFLVAGSWSCDKSGSTPVSETESFEATLNGTNEAKPNASTATGTAVGSFDTYTNFLTVTVTYSGFAPDTVPTSGSINRGTIGHNGPALFNFPFLISPINFTTVSLDDTQVSDLMKNLYYINLNTAKYPDGEIRGQLIWHK